MSALHSEHPGCPAEGLEHLPLTDHANVVWCVRCGHVLALLEANGGKS